MKILLLGFPVLKPAFEQLGHHVVTCTTDQAGDIWVPEFPVLMETLMAALPSRWSPDFILLMDESTTPMYVGLERFDVPLVWYTIDSHLHGRWHSAYSTVFDAIFVAQRDAVPLYVHDAQRQHVQWLPLFCCPERDRPIPLPKTHDISFVGMIHDRWKAERSRLLQTLRGRLPLVVASGEYVTVFNRSKVVLNECAANEVNFRIFEALACGSFLLTERVGNGFDELFDDGEHLVTYEKDNVDHLVDLARYYIEHEAERRRIAGRGRDHVLRGHTALHRAQTIIETIQSADMQALITKRRGSLETIDAALLTLYEFLAEMYQWTSRRYASTSAQHRFCVRAHALFLHMRSVIASSRYRKAPQECRDRVA